MGEDEAPDPPTPCSATLIPPLQNPGVYAPLSMPQLSPFSSQYRYIQRRGPRASNWKSISEYDPHTRNTRLIGRTQVLTNPSGELSAIFQSSPPLTAGPTSSWSRLKVSQSVDPRAWCVAETSPPFAFPPDCTCLGRKSGPESSISRFEHTVLS